MTEPHLNIETDPPVVLEEGRRLSHSRLWQLQRAYYLQQGMDAWRDGTVPYYITSNPYISRSYAQLIFAWLRDLSANTETPPDLSQPIYLVELGAGTGQLAYHFLKKFCTLLEASVLKHLPFRYVMTDFNPATLDAWQHNPQLRPFAAAGQLDFARFDVEHDESLTLVNSGETFAPGRLKNPLAVIANYFFDSLPQDVFRIEDGRFYESLVTLASPRPEPNPHEPQLLGRIQISYHHRLVSGDAYADPALNQILLAYQQRLEQTHLLIPVGALHCLHLLRQIADDRLLVVTGDKGFHHESDLDFREAPGIAVHGSFSMSVNFDALGKYAVHQGGQFLCTPHRRASLDICAFLFGGRAEAYPETRQTYDLVIAQGGPDDFYTLKKAVENQYGEMTLAQLLSYLRLSGWDSNIFVGCFLVLLEKLIDASDEWKAELYQAIHHIWENYYFIGENKDVPFALGLVLIGIEDYPEAIKFFEISLHLHGPDPSTFYYLGQCHYQIHELEQALAYAISAAEADPGSEQARALQVKIETDLGRA